MVKIDYDITASRAVEPAFYMAPHPPLDRLNGMVPMPFQHAGVEYQLARDNGIIGDPPGLTKTAQAIMLSNAIGAKSTLAVVPASLRLNWEREIWRWSTTDNVTTYPVLKASDGVSLAADWTIISYDLLRNPAIHAALMDHRWDHLILDEAHALKDPKGNQRTKAICGWNSPDGYIEGLADVSGRKTLLTGTLLPNAPRECYNAIRLCNHKAIDNASLDSFVEQYYDFGGGMVRSRQYDQKKQAWMMKLNYSQNVRNVPKNLDDLQYRLRKFVMVRRNKADVMPWLPKLRWHPFPLMTTPEMRRALKHPGWLAAERLYELDPAAFDHGIPVDGAISTAREELGIAKAPAVADYIEELLSEGVTKLIVAAWHHSVLDYLRARLSKYGLVYMDGRTSSIAKQKAVDDFQTRDDVGIILGQAMPLCMGWTLTAAQDCVNAEPDWVPGNNEQLGDRICRMGQKGDSLTMHIPICPNTLDEKILGTAIDKGINTHAALDRVA